MSQTIIRARRRHRFLIIAQRATRALSSSLGTRRAQRMRAQSEASPFETEAWCNTQSGSRFGPA